MKWVDAARGKFSWNETVCRQFIITEVGVAEGRTLCGLSAWAYCCSLQVTDPDHVGVMTILPVENKSKQMFMLFLQTRNGWTGRKIDSYLVGVSSGRASWSEDSAGYSRCHFCRPGGEGRSSCQLFTHQGAWYEKQTGDFALPLALHKQPRGSWWG